MGAELVTKGFQLLDPTTLSADDVKRYQLEGESFSDGAEFYMKEVTFEGKPAKVFIRLLPAQMPNESQHFQRGLASSGVVLYHGEGGLPKFCFDENGVLGKNDLHFAGDSAASVPINEHYQLLVMQGCYTGGVRNELRAFAAKDEAKLDLVLTSQATFSGPGFIIDLVDRLAHAAPLAPMDLGFYTDGMRTNAYKPK